MSFLHRCEIKKHPPTNNLGGCPICFKQENHMKTYNFQLGDVVVLNSGGPRMTIESIQEDSLSHSQSIECKWFNDDKKLDRAFFKKIELTKEGE